MSLAKKKSFVIFCISSYLMVAHGEAQNCHKLSTLQSPTQLLCNGFENILNFDIELEEDVQDIDLSKNNITNINEASFARDSNNIIRVYLDNNSITAIDANSFRHLPNLEAVDLSHNNITFIHPEAFTPNKKLKTIDLTGNQIQRLDIRTINRLDSLEELALSGNPIKVCSRKTANALSYLERQHIKTHFLDRCEDLIEDEDDDVITEPIPAIASDKRLIIFVVLGILSSLAIVMSIVVGLLCLRIFNKKKFNSSGSRRQRTLSGRSLLNSERLSIGSEDKDGYLIPKYPQRLSTASQDRDGYMKPMKPKSNPLYVEVIENDPLINGESSYSSRVLSTPPVPDTYTNKQNSEYSGSHVYEEIKEPSQYEINIMGFH